MGNNDLDTFVQGVRKVIQELDIGKDAYDRGGREDFEHLFADVGFRKTDRPIGEHWVRLSDGSIGDRIYQAGLE